MQSCTEMVHPHRQCGEEGATAPLQPQEAEILSCHLKLSQNFTDAQLRASCRAVSPPGMATAPPTTAGLSRGWCFRHNASPGANYLSFRTPRAPDVTGRPKRSKGQQPPEPLPVHPATIQKARTLQVHQSWDRETENSFYLKAIRLLNSHH